MAKSRLSGPIGKVCLLVCFLFYSGTALAERKKIGLVLEGGGALGFAHVGVLKVLERERIPVDFIAGTSMGSIVGAAYASGQSIENLEKVLTTTEWDSLFSETPPRQDLPYYLKPGRNREIYGDTKIGFLDGKLITPTALIEGQKILPVFQRLFAGVPANSDFEQLPVPFRAVAADIETGEQVILSSGNLALAARTSMAVPGVFAPVELNGRMLVDGGIANNFPVDIALSRDVDVVIGSYFTPEYAKRDELNNPLSILGQLLTLLLESNTNRSLALMRPQDILVKPDIRGYTSSSFNKSVEIMKLGEAAAEQVVGRFREYALSPAEYAEYSRTRMRNPQNPVIDFIRIKNKSGVPDAVFNQKIGIKEGQPLDREELDKSITALYNMGQFKHVNYALVTENGKTGVVIDAEEKKWLEQYARVGFSFEDNLRGESAYSLGLFFRSNDLNSLSAHSDVELEIGGTPRFFSEFYQPINSSKSFFIAPFSELTQSDLLLYDGSDVIAEYERLQGFLGVRTGAQLGSYGEAFVGVRRGFGDVSRRVGDPTLPEFSYDSADVFATVVIDQQDRIDFPREGYLFNLGLRSELEDLGSSDAYSQLRARAGIPWSFGRNTILFRADAANTFDRLPAQNTLSLGGFLDVSGYRPGQILASDYTLGSVTAYRQFSELGGGLLSLDFFLGGSLEYLKTKSDLSEIPDEDGLLSGSLFFGTDTPLVPLYLGFGLAEGGEHSIYLNLGRIRGSRRQ